MNGRGARAAIAVAALIVGGGAVALLSGGPHGAAHAPGGAAPSASTVPGAPGGPAPVRGPRETREEAVTGVEVPLPATLAAAIAERALGHVAAQEDVDRTLADARAGRLDPVEAGLRLAAAVREQPGAARPVLDALLEERRPELSLQLARALAGGLDDPELRKAAVDGLKAAPPEARATGLLTLLGRPEKEALDLAVASFLDDAPEARATAGFLLNERPGGLPGPEGERVREAARAVLASRAAPSRLRQEALGLLGRPGAAEPDLGLLETSVLDGRDPALRSRALAALVATEAPAARLRPTLERVLADKSAPESIAAVVRAYLASH